MKLLRNLVWLYLLLLIFEGALRKWGIPSLSAPLMLIRYPFVLLIYFQAARQNLRFSNGFFIVNLVLAVATAITATLFGQANILVTIYGELANYILIPFIFLIPQIIDRDDVLKMGKFFLYVVAPMTALLLLQFRSSPDSLWNRGAMATHYDSVRPTGTFSFNNGVVFFFAFAAAFLFYGFLHPKVYKFWLLGVVTVCMLAASVCSGSRSCVVSIGVVVIAAVFCVIRRGGKGGMGMIVAAGGIGAAVLALSLTTTIFSTGAEQLQQRFVDAGANENGAQGFFIRYGGTFLSAFMIVDYVPFFGFGLGSGTNAGMAFLPDTGGGFWPEAEWERLVFECGPVFGLILCAYRTVLTWHIGMAAYRALARDNMLPMLLFSACGLIVLNGQWGGPTPSGFAIFGAGLTLAACRVPEETWDPEHDDEGAHDHEDAEDEHFPAHGPV